MSNEAQFDLHELAMMLGNVQRENFTNDREIGLKMLEKLNSIESLLIEMNSKAATLNPTSSSSSSSSSEPECKAIQEPDEIGNFLKAATKNSEEEAPESADKSTIIFCFDCQQTFVRGSGVFSRHVRETSCKPYQCHCGKLFKKKSSLTAHLSTHSNAAFACECGAIFRCEQYLRNHKRRKHQDESHSFESPPAKITRYSSPPEVDSGTPDRSELDVQGNSSLSPMDLLKLQFQ